MATLYDIDQRILLCIDQETGEIADMEILDALQMERDQKIENIALWHKNDLADAEAIKAEREKLYDREKALRGRADSTKRYLDAVLFGNKFTTPRVAISFLKSKQVQISEGVELPDNLLTYKQPEPNKAAIKRFLKDGNKLVGVEIVEKKNIQIK